MFVLLYVIIWYELFLNQNICLFNKKFIEGSVAESESTVNTMGQPRS